MPGVLYARWAGAAQPVTGEQKAETLAYFDALFARKPDDLTVVIWVKGAEEKRTTYALTPAAAARTAEGAEGDVYAGVGFAPPGAGKTLGPRRRPSKSQVAGIVGLWCDIDVNGGPEGKQGAAPDRDAATELAHSLLPPTLLVDSGYGVQAYWLFDEPWLFSTGEERAGAQELEAKWLAALGACVDWKLDATHDPTRVLRVPGTFNLKGGLKAPVRLVHIDEDARYSIEDFAPHVAEVQLSLSHALNGSAPADDIAVDVRADAEPPFEKFSALAEVDELFASAWARSRQGDRSQKWSASEWDMALCDRAVRARWTDQELTDLMVAARRKHGDDLKRPDYYARTIARARATIDLDTQEARREEAIAELVAPPVSASDHDPDHVLSLFEQVVGVPLCRFVQYGRDPDEGGVFELVLDGVFKGQTVRIGDAETLLNPLKVRARVATVTAVLPPPVKREDWDKVVERLLHVRVLHESENESSIGVLNGWLRSYLANTEGGERTDALRHGYPHVHESKLYLSREHFQSYIRTRFGERIARRDLQSWLRAAGFATETVSYRKANGRSTTVSLYARPVTEGDTA